MALRTLVVRNVRAVVGAARGKQILFFPARHDHWVVQTGDGWAARGQSDFTADVVRLEGRACAKVGREYRPSPRLERVT